MAAPLWGLRACSSGKFGILYTLRSFLGQFCKRYTNHLYTAALGVLKERHNWALHEGSSVLDSTDVPSSAPKQSMPEVHGLKGSPALESTGALLSAPTKPSKDVCLIDIICSHHVLEASMFRSIQRSALHGMNINYVLRLQYWGGPGPP